MTTRPFAACCPLALPLSMRCKTCHYSLENLTGPPHRCPECGRAFDLDDPLTYDDGIRRFPEWLLLGTTATLFGFIIPVLLVAAVLVLIMFLKH